MKLVDAIALIKDFVKLRYAKKFHGKAVIIWKNGKIDTVEVAETFK
jgi:hypothetical protein